jgi:hypothetical protein
MPGHLSLGRGQAFRPGRGSVLASLRPPPQSRERWDARPPLAWERSGFQARERVGTRSLIKETVPIVTNVTDSPVVGPCRS